MNKYQIHKKMSSYMDYLRGQSIPFVIRIKVSINPIGTIFSRERGVHPIPYTYQHCQCVYEEPAG